MGIAVLQIQGLCPISLLQDPILFWLMSSLSQKKLRETEFDSFQNATTLRLECGILVVHLLKISFFIMSSRKFPGFSYYSLTQYSRIAACHNLFLSLSFFKCAVLSPATTPHLILHISCSSYFSYSSDHIFFP